MKRKPVTVTFPFVPEQDEREFTPEPYHFPEDSPFALIARDGYVKGVRLA